MTTITKENAKHHCRTCLVNLNDAVAELSDGMVRTPTSEDEPELKAIAINVARNDNLKKMLEYYIEKNHNDSTEYPQHVCLDCFNKLQGFDAFRKKALECNTTLQRLFLQNGVTTKVELNEMEEKKAAKTQENIYSWMLKDALMETESVVLMGHSYISALVDCELQTPDPFGTENIAEDYKKENKNSTFDNSDNGDNIGCTNINTKDADGDGVDVDDHNDVGEEEDDDDKPLSRLRKAVNGSVAPQKSVENRPKYRRRTKKEMEQVRQEESVQDAMRSKPRKRGTKNCYRCEQCNHSFAHKLTRDAHVRKVHEGSKRPYECDRCDKTYTFFGGLWTHIREIHEAEERSYPCAYSGCDKIYTSLIAMQKHRREKHLGLGSTKTYVCELCGTTFNQIANLKYHRRRKHPLETGDDDVDGTIKEEALREHHICNICQKQFHSRYTLKYHILQLHSSDMKFECNVCGRRMAKKFMLVQHMRIHTPDRLPCNQCAKQFIRKHELESHVRAVHLKLKPFGCQYCPETFACRKTLRHHEYIHTGEKPYICDLCGQAYRQQTSLKTHRKTHIATNCDSGQSKITNDTRASYLAAESNQLIQQQNTQLQIQSTQLQ